MTKHMLRELDRLREVINQQGGLVQDQVNQAIQAVMSKDQKLAQLIVDKDEEVDRNEVDIEEECLKLLALYQPVAIDLRYIISVLKINNDLERIGDHGVNMAERVKKLSEISYALPLDEIKNMSVKVRSMLRESLYSLVESDVKAARSVLSADFEVDQLNSKMHFLVVNLMQNYPERAEGLVIVLSISKRLERIADLSKSIAEDVIYMMEGEIIRHARNQ